VSCHEDRPPGTGQANLGRKGVVNILMEPVSDWGDPKRRSTSTQASRVDKSGRRGTGLGRGITTLGKVELDGRLRQKEGQTAAEQVLKCVPSPGQRE